MDATATIDVTGTIVMGEFFDLISESERFRQEVVRCLEIGVNVGNYADHPNLALFIGSIALMGVAIVDRLTFLDPEKVGVILGDVFVDPSQTPAILGSVSMARSLGNRP